MPSRLEKLEAMYAEDSHDTMTRYMLALEVEKTDDNERSLKLLKSLMTDEPPYVPAFLMAGQQFARLNRVSEARETYQAGIAQAKIQQNEHAAGEMSQFLLELPSE